MMRWSELDDVITRGFKREIFDTNADSMSGMSELNELDEINELGRMGRMGSEIWSVGDV
jgi:hypothetical protein